MANSTITRNPADSTAIESTSSLTSYAYGHYVLDQALTSATTVNVSMSGSGGAAAADFGFNSFQYQMGTFNPSGPWLTTSNNGPITLNAGYTAFHLRVLLVDDALAEAGEGVTFVVSQNASTAGIINSYWVPAQVDILDPQGEGASAFPRTIVASGTVPGVEGTTYARANYTIEGGTADYAGAEVKVSVTTGLGGSSTSDYIALHYTVGTVDTTFTNNSLITIPASATSFSLSADLLSDSLAESGEQLLFTVSQTANSIGLVNSWGVQNIVDLGDPANAGANVHSRTITAGATQTGIEGTGTVTPAMATYDIAYGAAGGGHATDVVKVGIMTGLGGSSTADYSNFSYSFNNSSWTTVDSNGLVTIQATQGSVEHLYLRANVVGDDHIAEAGEQLIFTVAQTATGPSLTNSWWVPNTVGIRDADGTGATAISRTITAGSPVTGIEGSTLARANYNLVDGATGTGYSNAVVKVGIVTGLGGSSTADYTAFSFTYSWSGGSSTPATVDSSGLVTIPASATSFYLSANVTSDLFSESSEQLMFTVSNTGASPAITDSWWVPNVVNLQDAQGTGAVAFARHITEGTPTAGVEGVDSWAGTPTPAIATFNVTYDGANNTVANYGATEVHVSMFGAGGASAADYSGFMYYRTGSNLTWWPVLSDGLITIPADAATFQLASLALTDSITETGEGITFAVSQTAKSIGLVDSWWVTSTVDLADAAPVYTVMTGANGADIFTPTSARDKFVILAGTSLAQTGAFDIINGGITAGTASGDLISLGGSVGSIAAYGLSSGATETVLLASIAGNANTTAATRDVGYYPIGSDLYLVVNTDGAAGFSSTDTLIKLVGAASLSAGDIALLF